METARTSGQILSSLSPLKLCIEKDLPIETRIYSGNEDDKTISKGVLKRISAYMGKYGIDKKGFIYTGEASMVTEPNLEFMGGIDSPRVKFILKDACHFLPGRHLDC